MTDTPKLALARRMRKAPTQAEAVLWRMVRDRRLEPLKFRRQVPLGPYVADFVCLKARIVVELDGGIHDAPFYDQDRQKTRDAWFAAQGFRVLRFPNHVVINTPHLVFNAIFEALRPKGQASPVG